MVTASSFHMEPGRANPLHRPGRLLPVLGSRCSWVKWALLRLKGREVRMRGNSVTTTGVSFSPCSRRNSSRYFFGNISNPLDMSMYRNTLSGCCGQSFVSTLPLTGFMTSGRMLSLSDPSFVPWENWNCDVILQGYFLGSNEIPFVKTFWNQHLKKCKLWL